MIQLKDVFQTLFELPTKEGWTCHLLSVKGDLSPGICVREVSEDLPEPGYYIHKKGEVLKQGYDTPATRSGTLKVCEKNALSFVGLLGEDFDDTLKLMIDEYNYANITEFIENLAENRSKGILDVVPLGLKDSAEIAAASILTNDLNLGICLGDSEHDPKKERSVKMLALLTRNPKTEPDKEDIANLWFMLVAMGFFEEVLKDPDDYMEKLKPVILKARESVDSLDEKAQMSVVCKDGAWGKRENELE